MLGTICRRLLGTLYHSRPLTIVETGTAFQDYLEPDEKDFGQRSTVAIAQWIAQRSPESKFYSIDQSAQHIQTCRQILTKSGLDPNTVNFVCGVGHRMLATIPHSFDFVLLDADSNGRSTLDEFEVVLRKLNQRSIILIDDAYKPTEVNKARIVMPYAKRLGFTVWDCNQQAVAICFDQALDQDLDKLYRHA